jgi:hypothetical protein
MELAELFLKAWPVLLGAVLEEKIKSAFEIINKMKDKP